MKSLPIFPQKRPVELSDKSIFDGYIRKYPCEISELTFTNIFAWRQAYQFELSVLDDFLLVISKDSDGLNIFEPIGPFAHKQDVILSCFYRSKDVYQLRFIRISEPAIELFRGQETFDIEEDRDNHDYLYKRDDLAELSGVKYDGKRNLIRSFEKNYPFTFKKITKDDIPRCLSFQESWCLYKDCCHIKGLESEKQACIEMLENFKNFGFSGAFIEIGSKIEALTLGEELNPETFVIHMEKANGKFVGIYQMINNLFVSSLPSQYIYVNRQQDLGVEGLRSAKESYHPCRMIKKYILSQRHS